MKFKTSIPDEPMLGVTAVSGATKAPGKTNDAEANLLGLDPGTRPSTAVTDAKCEEGVARKCIDIQVQGDGGSLSPNGNPKKRSRNFSGVEEPRT